jgi:hypothetical protein
MKISKLMQELMFTKTIEDAENQVDNAFTNAGFSGSGFAASGMFSSRTEKSNLRKAKKRRRRRCWLRR